MKHISIDAISSIGFAPIHISFLSIALLLASCTSQSIGPAVDSNPALHSNGHSTSSLQDTNRSGTSQTRHRARNSPLDLNTFIAENESSQSLGLVAISSVSDLRYLPVGSNEIDSASLSFIPSTVTINSQSCPFPDTTIVSLLSGAKISVSWTNPNLILILNYVQQD